MAQNAPPQNIEAEKSVLGAILLDSESLSHIVDTLQPHNFYSPQHALIYEAIIKLYQEVKPIDVVTLTNELKKMKKLREAGGGAYLSELIAGVPTAAHIKDYAQIVRDLGLRRQLISMSGQMAELAGKEDKSIEEVMDELGSKLFSVSQDNGGADYLTAKELLEQHIEQAEEYSRNPNALRGLPTGMREVDKILGGLHNSDLIILAARPAVGKSSFAFNIARHLSIEDKKSVMMFSLEMPGIQIIQRLLSQQINVSLWDLRMHKLTDEGYQRFADGADKLSKADLYIVDEPGVNINQIRSKARKIKMEKGLDFIMVDYLQLMQSTTRADNRAQEVSEISRSLKLLARELDVPVLALSQLNRAVENRNDRTPMLSDLRESGSIEQDADVVLFLNRDKLFDPETEKGDIADVIVAKHRNGAIGRIEMRFEEELAKFVDLPTE